jgi:hypothetical protein
VIELSRRRYLFPSAVVDFRQKPRLTGRRRSGVLNMSGGITGLIRLMPDGYSGMPDG